MDVPVDFSFVSLEKSTEACLQTSSPKGVHMVIINNLY
jgi:hypothetical protein